MKNTRVSSRIDTAKEEISNLEGVIEEFSFLKRTGKGKEIKIISNNNKEQEGKKSNTTCGT